MPFSEYIKTVPEKMPLVLIEAGNKSKFVLIKDPTTVTADDVT